MIQFAPLSTNDLASLTIDVSHDPGNKIELLRYRAKGLRLLAGASLDTPEGQKLLQAAQQIEQEIRTIKKHGRNR